MTHTPTPEQASIIEHVAVNPTRSLMVNAVAGAAKTSTIVMAAPGIPEDQRPLAIAFNKKIALELADRLPSYFTCKTLNALGHGAWAAARGGKRLILDADKNFTLAKEIMADLPKTEENDGMMAEVLALVRKAKSAGLVPSGAPMRVQGLVMDTDSSWDQLASDAGLWNISDQSVAYARAILLRSIDQAFQGTIDFDDQIYMSVLFGGSYSKYPTVIVDEAQDLSPLNHRQLVKCVGKRLIAIGDPYQAIYAFRGADNNSMSNMGEFFDFDELGLTFSMRVSKAVAARQVEHVPHFKSMDFTKVGSVISWPLPTKEPNAEPGWSLDDIPREGAVLCRNNAPLMKLAFALIKVRRPVKIMGRDIGANLASLLTKICGKRGVDYEKALTLIDAWKAREIAKVGDSESKINTIQDRWECLHVLLSASDCTTSTEAADFIRALFSDAAGGDKLVLSSGHRAKGFEWEWVLHLDPFRVPSKQAEKAAARGDTGPYLQEMNLKYVIETRTKDVLVLANLDDCMEVGADA